MNQKQKQFLVLCEEMKSMGVKRFSWDGMTVEFDEPQLIPHPAIIEQMDKSVEEEVEDKRERARKQFEDIAFYSS